MDNRKAQMGLVGGILIAFIAVIVGLALFNGGVSDAVGRVTTTANIYNQTITITTGNGTSDLTGQDVVGTPTVQNSTSGATVAANFTFVQAISTTSGLITGQMVGYDGAIAEAEYLGEPVNVTYVYEPDGYITNSGGRSIASLILIFMALAIAVAMLEPTIRSGIMDLMKG